MTAAYRKGYESGLRGDESQYSEWDAGYSAGEIERKVGAGS